MKVNIGINVTKEFEVEVDNKFHQLDGWHNLSNKEECDLRDELETVAFEAVKRFFDDSLTDYIEIQYTKEEESGIYLLDY